MFHGSRLGEASDAARVVGLGFGLFIFIFLSGN
jgi:hypothetical protein